VKLKEPPKKSPRAYVGVFIASDLKRQLQRVAREEKRSVNAQAEIFLSLGVQHLRQKQAA